MRADRRESRIAIAAVYRGRSPESRRATLRGNSKRIEVLAPRNSISPLCRSYKACKSRSERISSRLASVSPV